MLEVGRQDYKKERPTNTLPALALPAPPLPQHLILSLPSLAIFKNHTQAEINPSNVITDLLKPDVERRLTVPSPGSIKRALQFSLVL